MFEPSGFTAEGTFTQDNLIAGDHPIRARGVTLEITATAVPRGALLFQKNTETEFSVWDGGTITAGTLYGVLADEAPISAATQKVRVYICGDFNKNAITVAGAGDLDNVIDALAMQSIYLHDAVAA